MEDRKQKAIKHLNSPRVKAEVWLWIKLTVFGITGVVLSLIFAPAIDRYVTGWHPFIQLGAIVGILLAVFFYIRHKTL